MAVYACGTCEPYRGPLDEYGTVAPKEPWSGRRESNSVCLIPNQARWPLRDIPEHRQVRWTASDSNRETFSLQGSCSASWS